jgi:hypothetical protein
MPHREEIDALLSTGDSPIAFSLRLPSWGYRTTLRLFKREDHEHTENSRFARGRSKKYAVTYLPGAFCAALMRKAATLAGCESIGT